MTNKVFMLFKNCIPVIGYKNALIYDLQKNKLLKIKKEYANSLIKNSGILPIDSANEVLLELAMKFKIGTLIPDNTVGLFSEVENVWDHPCEIINCSVELNNLILENIELINKVKPKNISLIINSDKFENIEMFFSVFKDKHSFIELHISIIENISINKRLGEKFFNSIDKILNEHDVKRIYVYNSDEDYILETDGGKIVSLTKNSIDSCQKPTLADQLCNINSFFESQKFNLYYNRRIHINNDNTVSESIFKNHTIIINNLNSNKISEIFKSSYKPYWLISKDKINVCKFCEYRYSCLDRRLPRKNILNEFYYEDECDYNPFIGKWFHEKQYKTLSEIGIKNSYNGFEVENSEIKECIRSINENSLLM